MKIKRSITKRLFVTMTMMIVVFTLVLLAVNSLLLKPMYIRAIESEMIDALEGVEYIEGQGLDEAWLTSIEALNIGNDFDAIVMDGDAVIYSASPEFGVRSLDGNGGEGRVSDKQLKSDKNHQPIHETSVISPVTSDIDEVQRGLSAEDGFDEATDSMMIFRRHFQDDLYVYLIQPLEPVNNSVVIANRLLVICATVFLAISVVISMKLASHFTKPIKEIEKQVDAITKFDFSGKSSIRTGDELEVLGHEVDALSQTLELTMDQLNAQNKQLEKDVKSQKRFISNASHELRTPLALIKGYSEEIEGGYVKDQMQQQKYMTYISEEATKMSRLLDEILELSRLESGRMALREETFNLRQAIVAFLDKYDGFIRDEGLEVSVVVEPSLIGRHDPIRFEQILANFISNAAKYGDEQKKIIIEGYQEGGRKLVKVFNTGPPMKSEVIDHLWDGFYMADEARTSHYNSYGLGLSIVKAIQQVGGNGYGAANVEGGVVFWIDMKDLSA